VLIEIRREERRPVLAAFLALFGITAGHVLVETARDALFLAKLPASQLPWMYIAIAAAGLLITRVNRSRAAKGRAQRGLAVPLLASCAITGAFWAASGSKSAVFLYALYVWTGMFASIVITEFWLMISTSFTVAQAKRLFGFIGAGSVLGAVFGAAGARAAAAVVASEHLLLVGAALFLATAIGPSLLFDVPAPESRTGKAAAPRDASRLSTGPKSRRAGAKAALGDDLRLVARDPYLVRILLLVLFSTVAVTVVDYVFKAAVAKHVPDKAALGATFANIYVILNSASLIVQVGLVGWVLRTFGVHRAAWIMPLAIGFGSVGMIAGGGYVAALVLKGADGTLRHSLHRTSTELFYVPLSDFARSRAKPFIDLSGQRGGQALASLLILGLLGLGFDEGRLSIAVLVLALAWTYVVMGLRRHYLELFRSTLREGRIDDKGDLPALDLSALEALIAALNSPKDAEVLCALELIAAQKKLNLLPALILYHPSRPIVVRALDLLAAEKRADFLPIAERLIASHGDPEIRAAALRARVAVAPDQNLLRDRLEDKDPEVRATAVVNLLADQSTPADEDDRALRALLDGSPVTVRVALARAIAQQPSQRFAPILQSLSEHAEPEVRMEAALAMGRMGSEQFLPLLVSWLVRQIEGSAAREALVEMGEKAIEYLTAQMRDPNADAQMRWSVPRALAMFDPARVAPILTEAFRSEKDGVLRFRILRALNHVRAQDPSIDLDRALLLEAAEKNLTEAIRHLAWRVTFERGATEDPKRKTAAHKLIAAFLRDRERYALDRSFRLLALLEPSENFARIQRGLSSKDPKRRASSRELIEHLCPAPLLPLLLPMIDDVSDEARLARVPSAARPPGEPYEILLGALQRSDDTLGVLTGYHAQELGLVARPSAPAPPASDQALAEGLAYRAFGIWEAADG
jgi:ATP/ADP translocase/HEAT repeat protein